MGYSAYDDSSYSRSASLYLAVRLCDAKWQYCLARALGDFEVCEAAQIIATPGLARYHQLFILFPRSSSDL